MADHQRHRGSTPTIRCHECGEGIWTVADLIVEDAGAVHVACLMRRTVSQLTNDERSRLIRHCWDHEVACCPLCSRKYRVNEMGSDLVGGEYHFCPFCRVDLTWSIRQHIAACAVIRQNDPHWQAEVREALAHAREVRKVSSQLRDTSELTRVTSEVLQRQARIAAVAARRAAEESERIKREPPGK